MDGVELETLARVGNHLCVLSVYSPHRKALGLTGLSRLALKVVFQILNVRGDGMKVNPRGTPYSYS